MWFGLLFACTGKTPIIEEDTAAESGNDPAPVSIPEGPSKALDICEPMMEHQIIIGLESKDCDAEILDSYLEVVIQEFPFLQDQSYSIGSDTQFNWATWHQGTESQVLVEGTITIDWEGMWGEGTSFSGNYQGTAPDGTVLEGFFTGFNCQFCTIQ